MFCIKCGKTIDPFVDACPDCGIKVILPEGFDMKNVKKTMNGRSILIDDSPLPGTVPAYLASASVKTSLSEMPQGQLAGEPSVEEKPQDKKALILIIAAAVLGVVLIAILVAFFLGDDKNTIKHKAKENATAAVLTEMRTKGKSEKSNKDDFISDKTGVNTILGSLDSTYGYIEGDNETGKEDKRNEHFTSTYSDNKYDYTVNYEKQTETDNMPGSDFYESFDEISEESVNFGPVEHDGEQNDSYIYTTSSAN